MTGALFSWLAQPVPHDQLVQPVGAAVEAGVLKFPFTRMFAARAPGLAKSRTVAITASSGKTAVPMVPCLAAFRPRVI